MGVVLFQTKLMAAVLVTFFLVALEAPAQLHSYAFDSRSAAGSTKIDGGRKGNNFEGVSLKYSDDNKGEKGFKFRVRVRSLRSKRLPSPPPAPMRNRQKITVKAFSSPQHPH
ncbi:hypothetical protein SESBI_48904 [Sesbania bispinosa]|nr:hypothetical protein SESBI_48904 [Sesbania bispinosa]